jgi:hypothetical protein
MIAWNESDSVAFGITSGIMSQLEKKQDSEIDGNYTYKGSLQLEHERGKDF